jgi:hypothetical protein
MSSLGAQAAPRLLDVLGYSLPPLWGWCSLGLTGSAPIFIPVALSTESNGYGFSTSMSHTGFVLLSQIGNNQSRTTPGAEDDVRKKMNECPTHTYLCRPAGA